MGLSPAWVKTVNLALAIVALVCTRYVSDQHVVDALIGVAFLLAGGMLIRRPGDVPEKEIR